jgi:hypothetical protein
VQLAVSKLGRGVCTAHLSKENPMTKKRLADLLATTLLAAPAFAQSRVIDQLPCCCSSDENRRAV